MAKPLTKEEIDKLKQPVSARRGIYFLYNGDDIVYVGQSVNVDSRIGTHLTEGVKTFDSYAVHLAPKEITATQLTRTEYYYISTLKPKYNKAGIYSKQEKFIEQEQKLKQKEADEKHLIGFMPIDKYFYDVIGLTTDNYWLINTIRTNLMQRKCEVRKEKYYKKEDIDSVCEGIRKAKLHEHSPLVCQSKSAINNVHPNFVLGVAKNRGYKIFESGGKTKKYQFCILDLAHIKRDIESGKIKYQKSNPHYRLPDLSKERNQYYAK